ncbi:uncharacterized protein TNCV_621881 [Trichonephila clavipes]|nr:uncharacterized protein TNCV_621881 [Trichonephila clavipes]
MFANGRVPSRHGTLISRRAASPLVRLVEGKRCGRPLTTPSVLPLNWGGTEPNRTVTVWCSKLRLTTSVTWPFATMNFVGLDLAFADQVALVTTREEKCLKMKPKP